MVDVRLLKEAKVTAGSRLKHFVKLNSASFMQHEDDKGFNVCV